MILDHNSKIQRSELICLYQTNMQKDLGSHIFVIFQNHEDLRKHFIHCERVLYCLT